jgi:hypothetical protein
MHVSSSSLILVSWQKRVDTVRDFYTVDASARLK